MNRIERDKLDKVVKDYFKEIDGIYVAGDFREESFYPSLKTLIEECVSLFIPKEKAGVLVQPKRTSVGIPDILIRDAGKITGYIEVKLPDANLRDEEDSGQLRRYRNSLPNLILTNLLEFRLFRHGNLIDTVEIGRQFILQSLKYPPVPEKLDLFLELLNKFFSFSFPRIKTSSHLSRELAKRTRFLEHILQEEVTQGNGEISRFYKAFQEEIMETLTEERFADLYAQTITYGLFAARMKFQDGFKKELAWQSIPESLSLLKEIFHSFTGPHFPESLSWVVDDITQVLEEADIASILKEFKTSRWEEDPVIHFYETFLATYNPHEREKLGVYYTPLPIVSYIVKSIHNILKDKFGKNEGLAASDITLLDPAAGTLTFVVQAIKQVQKELADKKKGGLMKSYIEEHILPHFYAFELLMAPYTVGHLKVSLVLEEMGYAFKPGERFKFYLTNTLEMKEPKGQSVLIDLAREGREAKKIKEGVPILVILGNPPYSVSSENKSIFIDGGKVPDKKSKSGRALKYSYVRGLMDLYKDDVKGEKNIQPLSDDYIKFIRFAHWKLEQTSKGVLGVITNNSYLSGIIHRGMRKKLLESFDEVYILNLHGSSRIGEKTPMGGKDENVFDIQQGVAIALYVKLEKPLQEKKVYYADLWGLRPKKYRYLLRNDYQSTKWQELRPVEPYYFFVPKEFSRQQEYHKFWKVTDIFKEWSSGVKTHRDHLVVGFKKEEIIQRLRILMGNLPDELVKQSLNLKDTGSWKLSEAREKVRERNPGENIYPYAYRPFGTLWLCYERALVDRDRWPFMGHFFKQNLGIAFKRSRYLKVIKFHHVFVVENIMDINFFGDQTIVFPLYLYSNQNEAPLFVRESAELYRVPNFNREFLQAIAATLAFEPAAEEIFYYIYAVLYSPAYRKRHEEFLKIDFPRIPLPSSQEVFKELNVLGKELVQLHLLKHPALEQTGIGYPVPDANKVEKISYDKKTQRVYINKDQYFEGVPESAWEYRIGAYQVMDKYPKDRKGRRLSLEEINHYMKVAKAIQCTIELQENIDNIYEK